jgi:alpha/beta hydrolase family protein
VRRPMDARRFSGLVVLELLDPTMLQDSAPVWTAAQEAVVRAGHAWVGVTIKPVAIEALKRTDPARYDGLGFPFQQSPDCHPAPAPPGVPGSEGDARASPQSENGLAWDAIAQAGALLRSGSRENPLRDLQPRRIVAAGAGEAADYLVTFVNAAHAAQRLGDGTPVFDAYLAVGAGLAPVPVSQCAAPLPPTDSRLHIGPRDAPFIAVATGSELERTLHLRREDSDEPKDFFRRYEVAGASLSPAPLPGGDNPCEEPPSPLPIGWAMDAIVDNLAQLLFQGTAPPHAPPVGLQPDGRLARDGFGNVVGGLRLPQLQAPLASYAAHSTPRRADDAASVWRCSLTGTTRRFDSAEMKRLYGTRAEYLRRFTTAADEAVQERFLTAPDAASLKASVARTAPNF